MSRVFVIGDIHGACRALRQCLERSGFDRNSDHLICLGDVADGWPETKGAVDELLTIRNLTYILGNHDWWTLEWMTTGRIAEIWYTQGGKATIDSYHGGVPQSHVSFFSRAKPYFILENKLFVHAGFDPSQPLEAQGQEMFLWDRGLASMALAEYANARPTEDSAFKGKVSTFDEIYIGHTPVSSSAPVMSLGIWLMDTGAGWSGILSMMDIHSKEIFVSDPVPSLYPGVAGRQRNR